MTRIASGILVASLIRLAEHQGGTAVLLHRGEAEAGSILLELYEKGRFFNLFERVFSVDGGYVWRPVLTENIESVHEKDRFIARRRDYDPDLWVIELNVANVERFIAEIPVGA